MRIRIAAIGRLKAGPEREIFERFLDRAGAAGRRLALTFEVREFQEGRAASPSARKDEEAVGLIAAIPADAVVAALDEHGTQLDSRAFAARLEKWRDGGKEDLAFLIGGADGLGTRALEQADLRIAFGPMTWPHQLVRLMLAEQLYRAVTILSGHPYHRE
jgi:23S rRNA (pseudouridine1915-N3)-methyltransferase